MKFLLVATFLLVACMFTPSWAAPLREEDEARAVLRAIQLLLASENYGHSELQQSGNATSAPSGASECNIADSEKVDCGYFGIRQEECESKGCCWKESNIGGVPYCFHRVATSPQCQNNDRVECGYLGINEEQCEFKGCCWSPTTANGQPWCYEGRALEPECQTDPADRVKCGYEGIKEKQCKEGYGCCWNPTNFRGTPWCYIKPAPTPASSTGSSASTASVEKELHDILRFLNRN